MKNILLSTLLLLFISCGKAIVYGTVKNDKLNLYRVYKIETINDYYIIYASKKDSLYKIVSKKENKPSNWTKIKLNHFYNFNLHSRRENAPIIVGIKLQPMNYLIINCYTYEKDTEICIDTQNGIFDLYYADNIKGNYYIK